MEEFRKNVLKALIDRDKTTGWLVGEINAATGYHFDTGYLSKVLLGKKKSVPVISECCRILDLDPPAQYNQ